MVGASFVADERPLWQIRMNGIMHVSHRPIEPKGALVHPVINDPNPLKLSSAQLPIALARAFNGYLRTDRLD